MRPARIAFRKRYSDGLLRAIDWAMELDPLLRPQTVPEFRAALLRGSAAGAGASTSALGRLASTLLGKDPS